MGAVRPKKYLGQHFLADENIARKIAGSLDAPENAAVLEIGPGMGMLTRFLLERFPLSLRVAEIDPESVAYLKTHYPMLEGRILEGDILEMKLEDLFPEEVHWIGNLPYNISSPIFFSLLDHHTRVPSLVAMVQKEVAERICANEGNKTFGILSVLLQAFFKTEYLFTVSEKVFIPPPKVKSAVIRLTRKEQLPSTDPELLKKIVKAAFNQRRKMLRNALSAFQGLLEEFPEYATQRAEQLSVEDYLKMAAFLSSGTSETSAEKQNR